MIIMLLFSRSLTSNSLHSMCFEELKLMHAGMRLAHIGRERYTV